MLLLSRSMGRNDNNQFHGKSENNSIFINCEFEMMKSVQPFFRIRVY